MKSPQLERLEAALLAISELTKQQRKLEAASDARFSAPHGSSRAKITTLNARWMAFAEHRDRLHEQAVDFVKEAFSLHSLADLNREYANGVLAGSEAVSQTLQSQRLEINE